MAGSVNMQILVGNLGKDPEIKTFDNGERVANFTVATSQVWRDKFTGERKERTQWHNIAVHTQPLVDIVEKYARKGNKIYIQGQTEKRKYTDRNGVERETAEVVLRPYNGEITLLGTPAAGGTQREGSAGAAPSRAPANHDLDDEIPF
jgi:single stranded DNA-binding protein (ssb)